MSTSTGRNLAFALGLSAVVAMSGFLLNAAPPQAVGTWEVLGTTDPSSARSGAATATLEDDTTLIAGGRMLDGTVTDSVLVYDPTTNASTVVGHLASPRVNAAAARLDDGRVLIVGGEIADLLSADAEIFDPFTGTSDVVANMAVPRTRHAATRLADGKVLIVGGVTFEGVTLATAEVFDPETGSILEVGSMATPRAGASATLLIDNRVLVAGGNDGTQDLASAELFYPATQEFFPVDTPLSQARAGHTAVLLPHNGAVLIAGGTVADAPVANAPVATTDLFLPTMFPDPYTWSMGTFGPAEHLTHARTQAVSGPMGDDGYVFVAGGGAAEGEAYAFVTLKTDKDDYAPGEFALITGSGWQPGEVVELVFQEDPAVHPDYTLTLTANGEGKFSYEDWAPEQHDFGVRFFLMATGAASQRRAQMTFTDSGSFSYNTAMGKANTVTLAAGATDSTTLGVNVNAPKNNDSFNVSLSFADAPGGSSIGIGGAANQIAVSSVVQGFVTTSSADDNKNFTVTVTVGASVAAGSYELEATAIESAGNISDGPGWKFTIVVPSAKTTPTITFGAAPTPTFGGGNFTVSASTTNTDSSALVYSVVSGPCALVSGATFSSSGAGSCVVQASGAETTNFNAASNPQTVTIAKATAVVVVTPYTATYDGLPHTAMVTSITGVGGQTGATVGTVDVSNTTHTDAGIYDADFWTFTGTTNYNDIAATTIVDTINKATSTTVTVGDGPFTYDGTTQTGGSGTVTGAGGLSTAATSLTYTGDQVNAGTYYVTAHYAGDANHEPSVGLPVAIVINKASSTTVTVGDGPFTYDTTTHTGGSGTVTGIGGLNTTATSVTYTGDQVNAGTYYVTAHYAGDANHEPSDGLPVAIVINKASSTTVTVGDGPFTYDTTTHTGGSGTVTGIGGLNTTATSVTYTGDQVNAGTYYVTAHYAGDANHEPSDGLPVAIVINKASSTTVTVGDGPFTFDTTTHMGGSGTVTLAGGLTTAATSLSYTGDQVNAGTYYVTAHFAGDANHEPSDGLPVAIVINKASSTTVTVGDGPFTFDTTTHMGGSGTVTLAGGLTTAATSLSYTGDQVNAGTYYVTAHFAGDANHEPSDGLPVAIVINKASSTTVTVGDGPFTYDTTTHTGGSGTVTGIGGLNTTATSVTYTGDQVNAGTYYVTAHYAGDANHEPSDGLPVAIVINKASSTTVTVGDGPFTYDTTTHMGGSGTVTLAGGLTTTATSLTYTGDQVNAGTYYVTAHFAGDANHYPSDGSPVAIIIEKATSTTTVTGGTFPFDGIAHPATALVSGVGTGITQTAIVSYSGSCSSAPMTVAQGTSCTATANYGGDANHLPSSGMVTVTISPRSTTTTLSSSLDVSTGPVKVVLTATVGSAPIAGLPNPTPVGTVTFTDSVVPTMLGTVNLVGGVATLSTTTLAVGQHVVTATYNPSGAPANFSGSVSAANDAPAALITGPATGSINPINVPFNFTGTFTDVAPLSAGDPTAAWSFDGTSSIAGSVSGSAAAGTVANSKAFTAPGVYGVVLTVNDNLGGISIVDSSGGLKEMVIVYDANGGFVTGGGWINSPAGAYVSDISLTGKANFGFVSKYKKGASIPEGETEFQFHAAGLNFKSTSYQWLVVQGTSKAQYKGVGTINGAGSYQFLVSVVDGSPDKIRVKITNGATIVYDNLFGAPLDDAEPTTALGGGSIVIHTK